MMGRLRTLMALLLLLLAFTSIGCRPDKPTEPPAKPPATNSVDNQTLVGQTKVLTVYRAAMDDIALVPERVTVDGREWTPQGALQRLFAKPASDKVMPLFPPGTKALSLRVQGQVAYVDFPESFPRSLGRGSATEQLAVYAIVNTLTEFPEIKQVQLLVAGKRVESLNGHVDVSIPLRRDEKILQK